MGNHETTCAICKNAPSITCNGACDLIEERLTGRNPSRDARIREERARRIGEAVLEELEGYDAIQIVEVPLWLELPFAHLGILRAVAAALPEVKAGKT